jgi:hypothetical protein
VEVVNGGNISANYLHLINWDAFAYLGWRLRDLLGATGGGCWIWLLRKRVQCTTSREDSKNTIPARFVSHVGLLLSAKPAKLAPHHSANIGFIRLTQIMDAMKKKLVVPVSFCMRSMLIDKELGRD